jgi:6-phosphogluconate dehydrogenase
VKKANIGVIGLGVMGDMLAFNIERKGYTVAGYDLDVQKVRTFADKPGKKLIGAESAEEFVDVLESPRVILIMVPAGGAVDAVIKSFAPMLEDGDVIIDGGNSHYADTDRRSAVCEDHGLLYVGMGVSGGEYGARWGPSMMPGGQRQAWERIQPILEAIAAKVDGEPCVTYIGPGSAGHFVKIVHNGIEYADMQLIAEAYDLMQRALGMTAAEMKKVFRDWNEGELESYLIEITVEILAENDPESGAPLVDLIIDEAKQKGTGKWTSQCALDLGVSTPTINSAVDARILSGYREQRLIAAEKLSGPEPHVNVDREEILGALRDGLYTARICAFTQGFTLLRAASEEHGYDLDYEAIARIWRGGCIIRAALLEDIRAAFMTAPELINLLLDPKLGQRVEMGQAALRRVVNLGIEAGIPVPGLASALAYYDSYRTARLPVNLTQGQRDYFGAHTYRRLDREGVFHTEWVDMDQAPEG